MASSSPLRLALFDMDGTLVDGQHAILACMNAAWAAHDLGPCDPAKVRAIIGLNLTDAIERLLPFGCGADVAAVAESYRQAFWRLRAGGEETLDPLYPGTRAMLARLEREGVLLGVATGKSRRGLQAVLAAHDLASVFMTLQCGDDGPGKPNPSMVFEAMRATGVEPAQTVMVGDSVFDMEMAKNAGVSAVGVSWGYHPADDLLKAGAGAIALRMETLADTVLSVMLEPA